MKIAEFLDDYKGDRKAAIKSLFQSFPKDAYLRLLSVSAGEAVIRQGDSADVVFVLVEGTVQTVIHQSKFSDHAFEDLSAIAFFGEYEAFGELSGFLADVMARTDCKLLAVREKDYLAWMENDNSILLKRTKNVVQELLRQTLQGRRSLYMSSDERMIYFLIDYYDRKATKKNETVRVEQTRTAISQEIGFHTRTVNRATKQLEKDGLIELDKGKITITELQYQHLKGMVEKSS